MVRKKKSPPTRSKDLPATQGMLYEAREEIKSEIRELRHEIRTQSDGVNASLHQIKLIVEEQNARNKFVLDGLVSLFDRQERLERHFVEK